MLLDTFNRVHAEFLEYFTAPEQPRRAPARVRQDGPSPVRVSRPVDNQSIPFTPAPAVRAAMLLAAVLLLVAVVTVPLAQGLEDRIVSVQTSQLGS